MISGAIVNNVAAGGVRAPVADTAVGKSSIVPKYGVPAKADKSSAKDEAELKSLTSNVNTRSKLPPVVRRHIEALMAKKGREIVEKRLSPEVGRAVENAVQTSLKSGVVTEAESEGMRYAIGSEMLKRS